MGPRGFVNREAEALPQLRCRGPENARFPASGSHGTGMEALLMLMVKTGLRVGSFLLGVLLVAGLAGPALAGNVYSWVTDDGTYAFTDDSKRIPAKHREDATRRPMGKLTRYERYTPVTSEVDKSYAERIRERQTELREMATMAPTGAVVGAMPSQAPGLAYAVPVTGGGNGRGGTQGVLMQVPTGSPAGGDEVTTIESIRVKPRQSLATRHWTVVKKGDQIVTVIKGELRQRPLKSKSESDFDL